MGSEMCIRDRASSLPDSIVAELNEFFDRNVDWLAEAYIQIGTPKRDAKKRALQTLSLLEGAMLICTSKKDINLFDISTESILKQINS